MSSPAGAPPETRIEPVTDNLHGTAVVDPYRWLEGDNSNAADQGRVTPDVATWTDAQNAYTRSVLDRLPGRAEVEARMRLLMEVGSVSAPAMRAERYFFAKREGTQNQPVVYWRDARDAPDRVLIDPAVIDESGLTTVEWISPSADGRLLAYGTSRAGDENTVLRVLEVDSGRLLPDEIPGRTQAPDWMPDGSGFVYRNLSDVKNPYSGQVKWHRLGTDPAGDALIFRQFTPDEDPVLATTWGPWSSLSYDGRWLVLGYWRDTATNDVWIVDFARFLATGATDRIVVSVGDSGRTVGTVIDGVLYLHTTVAAPQGRVVTVPVSQPDRASWRDLVPERPDVVVEAVSFGHGVMAVTGLRNASSTVEVFDLTGRSIGAVAQPGIGTVAISTEEDRTEAYLTFTSFNYPTSILRVDLSRPAATPELWARPDVPVDPSTVEVSQVWYRSKDGTRISMFLVHRRGLVKDGNAPVLLTGYGGFNIWYTPAFSAPMFQWFDAGGVYAIPNLRGGGEYGDAWHEAGMLDRKQNVFDDFFAAAEWLIAEGYTRPARLAIAGGSNGGLLTGAAVTMRPELFGAVIIAVPLLDMLRYQHFLMARYWVPEYGSAEDPKLFDVLHAYSPYHHVRDGVAYPAILLTAGENDTRVHALHARKMAARLQAATSSDPATKPVLLWVDREAGHGQGKPLHLRLRDVVDQRMFLLWQLRVDVR